MIVATLISLGVGAVILYIWAASATYKNMILRAKAKYPSLPIDTFDLVFIGTMAVLWPVGWSLSYTAMPSLKSYTRPKNHRSLKTDAWATRELESLNILEKDR